mgnify:CR=1 FL=1
MRTTSLYQTVSNIWGTRVLILTVLDLGKIPTFSRFFGGGASLRYSGYRGGYEERKRREEKWKKKTNWFKTEGYTTVLFCPWTPNGELARRWREVEEKGAATKRQTEKDLGKVWSASQQSPSTMVSLATPAGPEAMTIKPTCKGRKGLMPSGDTVNSTMVGKLLTSPCRWSPPPPSPTSGRSERAWQATKTSS